MVGPSHLDPLDYIKLYLNNRILAYQTTQTSCASFPPLRFAFFLDSHREAHCPPFCIGVSKCYCRNAHSQPCYSSRSLPGPSRFFNARPFCFLSRSKNQYDEIAAIIRQTIGEIVMTRRKRCSRGTPLRRKERRGQSICIACSSRQEKEREGGRRKKNKKNM